jgi:hypothetical protein
MWIIPSRSRPHNVARLAEACRSTGTTTPGLVLVDNDDPLHDAYLAIDLPPGWCVITGVRAGLAELYNHVFRVFSDLEWYGIFADDVVPESPAWDTVLIEAAGLDGLAYGDDGMNGEAHATHFAVGGDLVREVGWLAFPGLHRLYIDTIWTELARARGVLRYQPEIKIIHHHPWNRMALMDATYRKLSAKVDRILYDAWKTGNNEKEKRS